MTIHELYLVLKEAIEDGQGELPVKIAYQPNYPMVNEVGSAFVPFDEDSDEQELIDDALYICESYSSSGDYLSKRIAEIANYR